MKVGEIKLASDFGKVIQFIMTKAMSYLFYSISILAFGKLISLSDKGNQEKIVNREN